MLRTTMALQGRALHKICHDLLRMSISGTSRKTVTQPGLGRQKGTAASIYHSGSSKCVPHLPCASLQTKSPRENTNLNTVANRKENGNSLFDIGTKLTSLPNASAETTTTDSQGLSLATWPGVGHLEYICPSQKLSTLPDLTILEQTPGAVSYDLPKIPSLISLIIDTPDRPGQSEVAEPENSQRNTPKEARYIMKIRRRKMKRHLLKKFRKRMAFTLRKIRREQRRKKEAVFMARLANLKAWGDNFDAKEWAEEELNKARLGGFYINVLAKKQ
ncbi:uncharacterized protein [Littorina saxatilis]|uniref:uncharacterized protein isoform X2 n=1 Tax=Littorina saxatilis TaxID=31220 RepID=UPI0038B66FD6